MKKLIKYTLSLLLGIICNYSYGQLTLSSTLAAGQYYNPVSVIANPGTTAHGSTGLIHLFVNSSGIVESTTYVSQSQTNILSNEASLGQSMPNTSLPVGEIPHSDGVSPSGAATYDVPIVVPPGTMGMVPSLSIAYNSQSARGLLGYGWSLSGISCISRLGRTPYHNFASTYPDQTQGVTLTDSDWFALDGNRLIRTSSGSYGANGVTYATESETFNLVTSNGTVGSGPEWFQVKTKNGLTIEYGNSLDSRLIPVGQSTTFVWYVDKITDQFGNYMTFTYSNSNGEVHIQEIDYTGNSNAGFTPYNSVVFTYINKTDANTTYVAGGALNSSVVLNNITINSHGTFFKEYSFSYASNLYTLLQEINETGADHTSLNPLQFSYGSDTPDAGEGCINILDPSVLSNYCVQADPRKLGGDTDGTPAFEQAAQFTLLDYNGDGKEDVISLTGTYLQPTLPGDGDLAPGPDLAAYVFSWAKQTLYTSQITCPYFSANTYSFPSGYPTTMGSNYYENAINNTASASLSQSATDFNGDGKDDYAVSTFNTSGVAEGADAEEDIHIALSTGTSFATSNTLKAYDMYNTTYELSNVGAPNETTFSGIYYLDMNGDGQVDVFNYHFDPVHDTEYYRVWLNASASSTTPQEQLSSSYTITPTLPTSPNFEIKVYEPPGSIAYLDFSQAIPMDLNGDGKIELVNVVQRGFFTPYKVIVSFDATQTYGHATYVAEIDGGSGPGIPGNGIVIQPDVSGFSYNINKYVPCDTNGMDSESYYNPVPDGAYSTYFSSSPYDNVYGITTSINNGSSPYVLFGDFNGDGISDVLSYISGSWTMNFGAGKGNYAALPVTGLSSDNPFNYPVHYYYAHDVNGDGKTDILEFTPNYGGSGYTRITTYYSTGTSFVEGAAITLYGHDINPETWQIAFGDFNGDGVDDLLLENVVGDGAVNGGPLLLYFHSGSNSRRLVEAVDGYNRTVQYAYQPLTNSSIYSQPQASSYRSYTNSSNLLDIQPAMYVVSRLTTVDGTGNNTTTSLNKDGNSNYITYTDTNSTTYTYQDAICSRLGLGMLGFLNITSYNTVTDYSTSNTYTVSPTFDNMVPSTSTVTAVSLATTVSDGTYTYTPVSLGGLRYFLPETKSVTNDDVGGVTSTTTYTYTSDNHGNVQEKNTQISITSNSHVVQTTDVQNIYTTSATWIPAAVATNTTTVTYLYNPSYTRTLSNSWDGSGHLTSTTTDPSTGEAVTTANTYDSHTGALLSQVVSSTDATCTTYTTSCTYDSYSQFKTSSTNPLGQVTQYTYNPMWGKIASTTTPDGLTTSYEYDAYGRSSQITTPDGLVQTLTYAWVSPSELPIGGSDPFSVTSTSLYSVTSAKSGSPTLETFYDWFDRKTLAETSTLSADVFKEQSYDAMGHDYQSTSTYQKTSISSTYGDYDPVTITKAYSDVEYRLTSVTSTCSSAPTLSTTYSYTASSLGNTTVKTTKPDGTASSQTTNPAGFMINSTDYEYGSPATAYSSVKYAYLSNGHADSVVLNGTTVNTFAYDAYARQTQMHDINFVNYYTYQYNAYNELVTMQDPNGNTCTTTYDALGRTSGKVSSKEGTYTYTYVNSGNGLDLLQSQQLGSNIISYTYDNLRRPTQVDVNGLTTSYTYDAYNNIATKTYPGGFSITNNYSTNGFLTSTYQTSGPLIWGASYMNPFGQYVDYVLGNGTHTIKAYTPYDFLDSITGGSYENIGYDFDPSNGNLLSRIENHTLTESFTYDASLNSRLSEAQAYYPCSKVANESPSIKTADVTMGYDLNGNIENKLDICAPSTYYTDGNSNNQVTEVPNSNSIINAGQSVTYTSFNAPLTASLGSYTMTVTYGPDNNRELTAMEDNLSNITAHYYGNSYEKTLYNGTNPTDINYIQCGGDLVGMYINQTSGGDMYYVYTDHIGSILTVTDGTNTYNQSFDPWGNYRSDTNGSYRAGPPAANPTWLYRGYTGHEHLPQLQLINANGRLYDPFINSMLSPDITVQSPTNTQNFNRYSYCLNNPLKYTDPSGFVYEPRSLYISNFPVQPSNLFSVSYASLNNYFEDAGLAQAYYIEPSAEPNDPQGAKDGSSGNTGTQADVTTTTGPMEGPTQDNVTSPSAQGTYTVMPAVSTYGVTPSPATGDGEDYSGYVMGAAIMGFGFVMDNPALVQEGEDEIPAAGEAMAAEAENTGPVQAAAQSQGTGRYEGVDNWSEGQLNAGDYVGRVGNPNGNFYFDLGNVPNSMSSLYSQVQLDAPQGIYQSSFTIYQLNTNINVGMSVASQNANFGLGGGLQFFIQNPTQNLTPMYTIWLPH